jgi:ComF family protein
VLLRSGARLARIAANDLATTLFPADCRLCSAPLLHATRIPICQACLTRIHPQATTLCGRCGEALDLDLESARFAQSLAPARTSTALPAEPLLCFPCRFAPPGFARAVAYAAYEAQLRELIHLFKYDRTSSLASALGALLAQAILTLESDLTQQTQQTPPNLLVTAVPLFPSKQRQRGYNQSELLAAAALAELRRLRPAWRLQPAGLLTRTRDTASQFELTPHGRRRNLQGAFAVSPSVPPAPSPLGRDILLIDDIYTTGATARECARVLRRGGARTVWVATLARAQTNRIVLWDHAPLPAPQGFG